MVSTGRFVVALLGVLCATAVALDDEAELYRVRAFPQGGAATQVVVRRGAELALVPAAHAEDDQVVARGTFANHVNATGWANLHIQGFDIGNDRLTMRAAGMVEASLTLPLVENWATNLMANEIKATPKLADVSAFVQKNIQWTRAQCAQLAGKSNYWYQVQLVLDQLDGFVAAYRSLAPAETALSDADLWLTFFSEELGDIAQAVAPEHYAKLPVRERISDGHCSALVRLAPGGSDLFVSHDTWGAYWSMIRIAKEYDLNVGRTRGTAARSVRFSSYPATVSSVDDFYTLSSGLVVTETTISASDLSLFKHVKPTGTVLEGIRNVVANRMAHSGKEWTEIFAKHNSGTYNNQFMVINYNLFKPNSTVTADLLWVLEQLPGYVEARDMSGTLAEDGYWASYNVAAFPDVWLRSGQEPLMRKYGDWFTWARCPRARIFARDVPAVENLRDMQRIMRYNDFQYDPLSDDNGENSICGRSDLNPPNKQYAFAALGHRCHGGIDTKITSYDMMHRGGRFVAISSPTYDEQPVFQWSTSDFDDKVSHVGVPERFRFGWYEM